MADAFSDRVQACEAVLSSLLSSPVPHDPSALCSSLTSHPTLSHPSHKPCLELAFRTTLQTLYHSSPSSLTSPPTPLPLLLDLSIAAASSTPPLVDPLTPFLLLDDAFDYSATASLPSLFHLLVERQPPLSSPTPFFAHLKCRLSLVRTCNSLLRRMGKTMAAEWQGSVMQVVASMMQLDERGGLNLGGKFNVDNHTNIEHTPKDHTAASEGTGKEGAEREGEEAGGQPMVDYAFYRTLWSLQGVFSDPPQLKQAEVWGSFTSSLTAVLDAFERSPPSSMGPAFTASSSSSAAAYFPKYLSGSRLLSLQLQDATFRRHLLTQSLILFQYLLNPTGDAAASLTAAAAPPPPATAPGPAAAQLLSAAQLEVVRGFVPRVLQLLDAPGEGAGAGEGDRYGQRLLAVLRDELAWMRWKANKAPSFARPPADLSHPLVVPGGAAKGKERRVNRGRGAEAPVMGGEKLAELWGSVLSNEESIVGNRGFAPDLQAKLSELLEEEDEWQEKKRKAAERVAKREVVKQEGQAGGEEAMTDDGEGQEDEELDERSLLRKDKQRQWTLLRLLRRSDFALFQKSDGSLDAVVEELTRQRKAEEEKNSTGEMSTPPMDVDHAAVKQEKKEEEAEEQRVKEEDVVGTKDAADAAVAVKEEGDESMPTINEEPVDGATVVKVEEGAAVEDAEESERLGVEHEGAALGDGDRVEEAEEDAEDEPEAEEWRRSGEGTAEAVGEGVEHGQKRKKEDGDDVHEEDDERRKKQRMEEEAVEGEEEQVKPQAASLADASPNQEQDVGMQDSTAAGEAVAVVQSDVLPS